MDPESPQADNCLNKVSQTIPRNPVAWLFQRLSPGSVRSRSKTRTRQLRSVPRSKTRTRSLRIQSVEKSDAPFLQKCFDPILIDEVAIASFLADDPDNVVVGNKQEMWCWDRNDLRNILSRKETTFYNCSPKGTGFNINRDLDRSKTQVKVGSFFYVETSNFRRCLASRANYWEAVDTGTRFSRIGSVDAMDNLRYVSGTHCTPGSSYRLYKLIPRIQTAPPKVSTVAQVVLDIPSQPVSPIQFPSDISASVRNLLEEIIAVAPRTRKRSKRVSPRNILSTKECEDKPFLRFRKDLPLTRPEAEAFRLNDTINPKTGEPIRKCSRAWYSFDYAAREKYSI